MIKKIRENKILFYLFVFFMLLAGINHFIKPTFYYPIIPFYLAAYKVSLNIIVGFIEIVLAVALLFNKTKSIAANGIILLLILLIPAHIQMIQMNGCFGYDSNSFCIPIWAAWLRLFPFQFILILWAKMYISNKEK